MNKREFLRKMVTALPAAGAVGMAASTTEAKELISAPPTSDYDATTLLRCKAAGHAEFGTCPGGILRMEDKQASIVVQNQLGEQFTVNFMTDYVNATNREVEARLEGDTWILNFANGEVWEVPLAAIEGG